MSDDNDSFGKAIAFFVMMVSYGIALFTSIIWMDFLPSVYHGFKDIKAEAVIGGIFQLSWICSNIFALLGHGMILAFYSQARWFCILVVIQLLLFLFVTSFLSLIY